MSVKKRLLLDRVTLHTRNIAIRNVECTAAVETNLADTRLAVGNRAAMAAGIAAYSIPIQLLPKGRVALADSLLSRQYPMQRSHTHILRLRYGVCLVPVGLRSTSGAWMWRVLMRIWGKLEQFS